MAPDGIGGQPDKGRKRYRLFGLIIERLDNFMQTVTKKVKIEIFGEELIEKEVRPCGKSTLVYLPSHRVGRKVKIIKID
jgi:hypothetical protein